MSAISDFLKTLREQRGMAVAQVSREAGISAPYLYQIEDGRRNASAKVLGRLAHVYKVKVEELLMRAELLPPAILQATDSESREAKVTRAFEYVMKDPGIRGGSDAMGRLPVEAKLSIIRLYEKAEGLRILPDDL